MIVASRLSQSDDKLALLTPDASRVVQQSAKVHLLTHPNSRHPASLLSLIHLASLQHFSQARAVDARSLRLSMG